MNKEITLCLMTLIAAHSCNAYDHRINEMEQEAEDIIERLESKYKTRVRYLSNTLRETRRQKKLTEQAYSDLVRDYKELEKEYNELIDEYETLEKRNDSIESENKKCQEQCHYSSHGQELLNAIENLKEKMRSTQRAYINEKQAHEEAQKIVDEEIERYEEIIKEETEKYETLIKKQEQQIAFLSAHIEQHRDKYKSEKTQRKAYEDELKELRAMHPETFANRDAQRSVKEAQEYADRIGAKSSFFLW